jgi:hypothetical protein
MARDEVRLTRTVRVSVIPSLFAGAGYVLLILVASIAGAAVAVSILSIFNR